jgi:hypothetical protein
MIGTESETNKSRRKALKMRAGVMKAGMGEAGLRVQARFIRREDNSVMVSTFFDESRWPGTGSGLEQF